jgi:DNA-binding beta-propeller fold protein YncE
MPAFGNALLSSEEVLDILSYLKSMGAFPGEAALKTPPPLDGAYKYVALDGAVRVYDLDEEYAYVKQIRVRGQFTVRGIAANAGTGRLYVSFNGRKKLIGGLACIDLSSDEVLWIREYSPGIDSFALSPDGKTIYMPTGEGLQQQDSGEWLIINALSGDVRKRAIYGTGPHNTIVSPDGKFVYFAPVATTYLGVLDASTEEIVGQVGPFGQNVRPFAVTSDGAFALVNVDNLSGFEVADLGSRKVIHRVQVEGFPWEDPALPATQSHGVALSPDETEAWVSDAWNRHVHVFDITGLPGRPRQIASVEVTRPDQPETLPKWINFSRDGRYVHISNGAIIDAKSREVAAWVAESRHFVEIHFEQGRPLAAFPRYGVGYRNPAWWVNGK